MITYTSLVCVLICIGCCAIIPSQALDSDAVCTLDAQSRRNSIGELSSSEATSRVLKSPTFKFYDSERTSANVFNPFMSPSPLDTIEMHASEAISSENDEKPLLRIMKLGRRPRLAKTSTRENGGASGLKKNAIQSPYKDEMKRKLNDISKFEESKDTNSFESSLELTKISSERSKKQTVSSRDHFPGVQKKLDDYYKRKNTQLDNSVIQNKPDSTSMVPDTTVQTTSGSREKGFVSIYDNTVPKFDNSWQHQTHESMIKPLSSSLENDQTRFIYDSVVQPQFVVPKEHDPIRPTHDNTVSQFSNSWPHQTHESMVKPLGSSRENDQTRFIYDNVIQPQFAASKEHDQKRPTYGNIMEQSGGSQEHDQSKFVYDTAKHLGGSRERDQTIFVHDSPTRQVGSLQEYGQTKPAYDWAKFTHDNTAKQSSGFQNYDQNGLIKRPEFSQECKWAPLIQGSDRISNPVCQQSPDSLSGSLSTCNSKNSKEHVFQSTNGESQPQVCFKSQQSLEPVHKSQPVGFNSVDSLPRVMNSEPEVIYPMSLSREDFHPGDPTQKFQRSSLFLPFCPEVHNISEIYLDLCKDMDCDEAEFFEELKKKFWTEDLLKVAGLPAPPIPSPDSLQNATPSVPPNPELQKLFTPELDQVPEIKIPSFLHSNKMEFGSFEKSPGPISKGSDTVTTLEQSNLKIKSIGPANRGTVQKLGPNMFACLHSSDGQAQKTISNVVDNSINFVEVGARTQPTSLRDVSGWSQQMSPIRLSSSDTSISGGTLIAGKPVTSFQTLQIGSANSAGFLNYPFSDPKPVSVERIPSSPDNDLGHVWDNCNNIMNRKPEIDSQPKPIIDGPPKPDFTAPPKPKSDGPLKPDFEAFPKPKINGPPKPDVKATSNSKEKKPKKSKKKSSERSGSDEPELFEEALPELNQIISKKVMKGKPDENGNSIIPCVDEIGNDGGEEKDDSSESVEVEVHIIRFNCSYRDTPENKRNADLDLKNLHKGETWPHLSHLKLIPLSESVEEVLEDAAESNEIKEKIEAQKKNETEAINKALDPNKKSTN